MVARAVNVELVAFGVLALAIAVGLLSAARHLYPRLGLSGDALETIRFLTALIVGILVLTGLGLVGIGLFA